MKIRILMLSLIGLIFFNSCSNDSNSTNSSNSPSQNSGLILPKRITNTKGNYYEDFFYNQNKIEYINYFSLVSNDKGKIVFTYSNDFISKIEFIDTKSGVILSCDYIYQNNKLIKSIFTDNFSGDTDVSNFVYNSDGTITSTNTTIGDVSQTDVIIYSFSNGLISNCKYADASFIYDNFEYFTTNSPFKNIKGLDKILFSDLNPFLEGVFLVPINNIKSISNPMKGSGASKMYYEYTYNENMYPTIINEYSKSSYNGGYTETNLSGTKNITYY